MRQCASSAYKTRGRELVSGIQVSPLLHMLASYVIAKRLLDLVRLFSFHSKKIIFNQSSVVDRIAKHNILITYVTCKGVSGDTRPSAATP